MTKLTKAFARHYYRTVMEPQRISWGRFRNGVSLHVVGPEIICKEKGKELWRCFVRGDLDEIGGNYELFD